MELQHGSCFYCDRRLKGEEVEVDHFVPWARHPNDAIENLVATHARCNASKSDHLAANEHLERWVERDGLEANLLAKIAADSVWRSEPELSLGVAHGIYLRLPSDTRLWQRGGSFGVARHSKLVELLS